MKPCHLVMALWFIPFCVVNVIIWHLVPCEWSRPYA